MRFPATTSALLGAALLGLTACAGPAPGDQPAHPAPEAPSLAILPLQGLVAEVEDLRLLATLLREAFESSPELVGRLVPQEDVERVLAAGRIRIVDTLSPSVARRIAGELGGVRLLTSSLVFASAEPEPTAAVMLRLYDASGRRLGSRLWLRRGSQDQDLFGLNGSDDLDLLFQRGAPRLAEAAFAGFGRLPGGDRPRLAVFPFESSWEIPASGPLAGLIASHLLEEEFGSEVLEPGDLNEAFLAARIRYLRLAGVEEVKALGRAAGVRWLVTGSVLDFDFGKGAEATPSVSVVLRVFDVESGQTVASTLAQRHGDDGEILFGAGRADHPILNLADAIRVGLEELQPTWQGS
ncbi:MAG: hypothetical protein H8E31_10585 [Planctomycetes bacterium]|nr:hypothetical protein [Planctomycetota bacterium]